jgi:hypothetical protein
MVGCALFCGPSGQTVCIVVGPWHCRTNPPKASATSLASLMSGPSLPMAWRLMPTAMHLPREAPLTDAPGIVRGGEGCHTHKHVRAMAVTLQAA